MKTLPQTIKPELVEIGDLVSVDLPKSRGIVMSKRGRVAKRQDRGDVRVYLTEEGAILFTWQPGKPKLIKITLIERQPFPQQGLWDIAV